MDTKSCRGNFEEQKAIFNYPTTDLLFPKKNTNFSMEKPNIGPLTKVDVARNGMNQPQTSWNNALTRTEHPFCIFLPKVQ